MAATRAATKKSTTGRQANIKEVARQAEVSVATVSRTMRHPDSVAAATRTRVQAAMADLGYRPNIQARNLRTAQTRLIIVLVTNIANPYFAEVIRGIEAIAHENGYSILLGDVLENRTREQAYMDLLAARQADGMISLLPQEPSRTVHGSPMVIACCTDTAGSKFSSVFIENERAARGAVDYLISLGHRQVGFITGWTTSPNSKSREEGYRAAMSAAGAEVRPELIATGEFNVESGYRAAERLMLLNPDLTAIFCSNDEMALGAIRAIKARGLKVPGDISVVGFDGIHLAPYFDPPLTTVATPMRELGEEAMRILLDELRDPSTPQLKRLLPTSLVIRESTGAPPKRN